MNTMIRPFRAYKHFCSCLLALLVSSNTMAQIEMLPPTMASPTILPAQPYPGQTYAAPAQQTYAPYVPQQMIQGPVIQGQMPQDMYGQPYMGQPMMPQPTLQQMNVPREFLEGSPVVKSSPIEEVIGPDQALISETVGEEPPMQPVWYNPASWLGPWWNGSISLGVNGSDGNANSFNIRSGFELSRETERTNWDLDLTYNKNTANELATAHNALLQSNWDFKMRNPRWTWFNKLGLEYDEFKNFDLRLFLNTGLGYTFIDNEITQFRGRFGSGVSREFGGIDEDWKPEAVFGIDYARQISERQRFVATVDYYPAWEDFSDYRVVSDFGWEMDLDAPNNLSLKIGVIDRYDSTPNGALANDVDYSVLLIWTL